MKLIIHIDDIIGGVEITQHTIDRILIVVLVIPIVSDQESFGSKSTQNVLWGGRPFASPAIEQC